MLLGCAKAPVGVSFGPGMSEANDGPAPCRKNCAHHRSEHGDRPRDRKRLAAEGVQVAAVARRTPLLEELAREIERGQGPGPLQITQDMMAANAPMRLRDAALAGLGHVDILVNCAGGSRPLPVDAPEESWEEAITLNFTGSARSRTLCFRK
jgi:hypothetical protein